MTAVHNEKTSDMRRSGHLDQVSGDGVCLNAGSLGDATVITATGELDASNIDRLTDYVRACLAGGRALILDLSQLGFLGAQGIRALFEISEECEASGTDWALVPGHPVTRLLRICDTGARLPAVASIAEALERFSTASSAHRLLQLVTKSG